MGRQYAGKGKGKGQSFNKSRDRAGSSKERPLVIPDEIRSIVNDIDDFRAMIKEGKVIQDDDADDFDRFCARIFMETLKTKDGVLEEVHYKYSLPSFFFFFFSSSSSFLLHLLFRLLSMKILSM